MFPFKSVQKNYKEYIAIWKRKRIKSEEKVILVIRTIRERGRDYSTRIKREKNAFGAKWHVAEMLV